LYATSIADEIKAVKTAVENRLDMGDAIQYIAALSIKADAIISFDKDFGYLKIPRKEPSQIIQAI